MQEIKNTIERATKKQVRRTQQFEANAALGLEKNHCFHADSQIDKTKVYVFLGCKEGKIQTVSSHIAIHLFGANKCNLSGPTGRAYQINIYSDQGVRLDIDSIARNISAFSSFTRENESKEFHVCNLIEDMSRDMIRYLPSFFRIAINCSFPESIKDKLYGIVEQRPCQK